MAINIKPVIDLYSPHASGTARNMMATGKRFMVDASTGGFVFRKGNKFFEIRYEREILAGHILILLTIAPEWEEGSRTDSSGKSIYAPYFYRIVEKDGVITIARTAKKVIEYIPEGLNLTIQTDGKNILANVANYNTSYEEEIGAVDWRRNIYDLPDRNLRWGDATVSNEALLYEGSQKAQTSPKADMETIAHARHSYYLEDGVVKGKWLVMGRLSLGTPSVLINPTIDYSVGFYGRLEQVNNLRDMFQHTLSYYPIADDGSVGSQTITKTYTDIHTDYLNWTYHVPIMMVSKDKALRREVVSTGDTAAFPCTEQVQVETLYLGDEVLDAGTFSISATFDEMPGIVGADTIGGTSGQTYTMGDGTIDCPRIPYEWSVTGSAARSGKAHITANDAFGRTATLTTSGACGMLTISVSCGGCGTKTKAVRVTTGYWNLIAAGMKNGAALLGSAVYDESVCSVGGVPTVGCGSMTSMVESISGGTMTRRFYIMWIDTCTGGWGSCSGWDQICGTTADFPCPYCYQRGDIPGDCAPPTVPPAIWWRAGICRIEIYEWCCVNAGCTSGGCGSDP